jgi:membrane protease YdiL (CAAX protease family)
MGSRWSAAWQGHILRFGRAPGPPWDAATGLRVLACVLLLEVLIGPRFGVLAWLGVPIPPPAVRVPLLLAVALVLLRGFAHVPFAGVGLRPWRAWSAAEKWYFIEVLVLADVVMGFLYPSRIHHPGTMLLGLLWGFHQELVYRGMLQGELVRRFGAAAGILAANVLFTFGPLHAYHYLRDPPAIGLLGAVFAVGLFFGVLSHRSGNLWMAGIFHGVGNAWVLGPAAT